MHRLFLFAALALSACAAPAPAPIAAPPHPEARPFAAAPDAGQAVDAALAHAVAANKRVIMVFGYDACHDSRGLAGWFDSARFQAMLQPRYEIVWIDVGPDMKRHADLAQRFGVAPVVGTPTVVITDGGGHVLNAADAPGWRNAASRDPDAIYRYFENGENTHG
jgi:thioredoxin-related protein